MKKLIKDTFIAICVFIPFMFIQHIAYAEHGDGYGSMVVKSEPKTEEKEELKIPPQCPYTRVIQKDSSIHQCTQCHVVPSWKIKESEPDETLEYPNSCMRIRGNVCTFQLQSDVTLSVRNNIDEMFDYLSWHPEVDTIHFEILSGGGSMFIGWEIISLLEANKSKYKIITSVKGLAASAAFLIFCAGEERLIYPNAFLMWHETWSFSFFSFDTVSSSEEKARVMRLFQDNCHNYLIGRGLMTKEELDDLIEGVKDLWLTGKEALEKGFATGLIQ